MGLIKAAVGALSGTLGDTWKEAIHCPVIGIVLCTTGLSDEQLAKVKECSAKVAILKSANMSLGINTLMKLLKDAANVFAPAGYDIEIVEKHHNQKVDAPSGTAIALADSINEARGGEYEYVYVSALFFQS